MTPARPHSPISLVLLLALAVVSSLARSAATQTTADGGGWKQATPSRPVVLPADHASHPEYKLEWWYYTGNLDAADGRRFGYQITFFRVGIDRAPRNPSRWAVRDLFMAHLAVTDVTGRRLLFAERLNRGGVGWAGAETERYHVWNEDWSAGLDGTAHRLRGTGTTTGQSPTSFGLDLSLVETGPALLHGASGYSQKGSDAGNASHYYSLPRLRTTGTLRLGGETIPVEGLSWMDHEFGTSFLEAGQIGWDWFALQLQDGSSLMIYRFRRSDGSEDPRSGGTLQHSDGRAVRVSLATARLQPTRTWTSADSRARYPVAWQLTLPDERVELTVTAVLDQQELRSTGSTRVTYWEGAVDVAGTVAGRAVTGRGYLEMTGYAGRPMSEYLR